MFIEPYEIHFLSGQYFKTPLRYSRTIAAATDSAKPPQNFSHLQKFLRLFRLVHILFQLLRQKWAMSPRNMKNVHFLYVLKPLWLLSCTLRPLTFIKNFRKITS